ncbi:replication initiation factor domain-containing protein [Aeromonas jandaei]|uniref:replication initiation factor domain-containing protein n=1 Tax=Aeromonas jandaei TaxID=650 RepID=UPI00191DA9EC|nr:replication initiation factor domain-containing protein [Aeromonas jandaei]MBL0666294.1 replication initiation factor domain-containing protein [Aeromonas jandaei]MBL0666304.1 replication initiation factor domain-containing protein [Aeromonas jandaei]
MTGHNSKIKIDFLSFTFTPEPLKRITELAKQGALLKAIPRFDVKSSVLAAAMPAPAVDGMIFRRPAPALPAPASRLEKAEQRLRAAAYPEPLYVVQPETEQPEVVTLSMTQAMETVLSSRYTARADIHRELKAVCSSLLDFSEFEVNPDGKYWDAYNDLIHCYGVQFLDALCCSELEIFFEELNYQIGVPIPAPRFTVRHRRGGLHGYSYSGDILIDGVACGLVAWGAANHGCMVSFTGAGCDGLDFDALHRVISVVPGLRITRVDLALDDYSGSVISYLRAVEAAELGHFHPARGTAPKWMAIQAGEFIPEVHNAMAKRFGMIASAGCSFYVGSRANGKCARIYEKGKQMESEEHPNWVRAEGELHSKDRIIPLDVLINPDPYFAGMYPQFAKWLDDMAEEITEPVRITTFKNKFKTCRDNAVVNMSRMAGRLVNFLKHVEGLSDASIVRQLTAHLTPDDIPTRLLMPLPPELEELASFEPKSMGINNPSGELSYV